MPPIDGFRDSCRAIPVKSGAFGVAFAEAVAGEAQAVSVVHEPVENGIGHSWVGAYIDTTRKERRMFHAVGDGMFIVDGCRLNRRRMMASKLPEGI